MCKVSGKAIREEENKKAVCKSQGKGVQTFVKHSKINYLNLFIPQKLYRL